MAASCNGTGAAVGPPSSGGASAVACGAYLRSGMPCASPALQTSVWYDGASVSTEVGTTHLSSTDVARTSRDFNLIQLSDAEYEFLQKCAQDPTAELVPPPSPSSSLLPPSFPRPPPPFSLLRSASSTRMKQGCGVVKEQGGRAGEEGASAEEELARF
eukprot:1436995-Rhodomonas_salina.1